MRRTDSTTPFGSTFHREPIPAPWPSLHGVPGEPQTLTELVASFEEIERLTMPNMVVGAHRLSLFEGRHVDIPGCGSFTASPWCVRQLAAIAGVPEGHRMGAASVWSALLINEGLADSQGSVLLRAARPSSGDSAPRLTAALVDLSYNPLTAAALARLVLPMLVGVVDNPRVLRADITDRTTSFVVALGDPFTVGGSGDMGEVIPGLLVRTSTTGDGGPFLSLHLTRTKTGSGIAAPIVKAGLVECGAGCSREVAENAVRSVAPRLRASAATLRSSAEHLAAAQALVVRYPLEAVRLIVEESGLPRELEGAIVAAYAREPLRNAFGVSQAFALVGQWMSPETRFRLELVAAACLGYTEEPWYQPYEENG
jgi:hypothetical protein